MSQHLCIFACAQSMPFSDRKKCLIVTEDQSGGNTDDNWADSVEKFAKKSLSR